MNKHKRGLLTEAWLEHVEWSRAIEQEPCVKAFANIQTTEDSLATWAYHGITESIIRAFIESLDTTSCLGCRLEQWSTEQHQRQATWNFSS